MNTIESPRTSQEPERFQARRWFSLRRWLGSIGSKPEREDRESVSNGNGSDDKGASGSSSEQQPQAKTVLDLLDEANDRERKAKVPPGFPEPLKLGPQRNANSALFRPPLDVSPEDYLKAAQQLDKLGPIPGLPEAN